MGICVMGNGIITVIPVSTPLSESALKCDRTKKNQLQPQPPKNKNTIDPKKQTQKNTLLSNLADSVAISIQIQIVFLVCQLVEESYFIIHFESFSLWPPPHPPKKKKKHASLFKSVR